MNPTFVKKSYNVEMFLTKFFLVSLLVLAVTQGYENLENDFFSETAPNTPVPISVIDSVDANRLFKKFTADREIPFRYPVDGCYARAMAMAQIADKESIVVGKVFAEGMLQAKTNLPQFPLVRWSWHVATVVYVKDRSEKKQLMVLDPSLFSRPVTVEEWKNKMLDTTNGYPARASVYFGARFQYGHKRLETVKKEYKESDLDHKARTFAKYIDLQDRRVSSGVITPLETAKGTP